MDQTSVSSSVFEEASGPGTLDGFGVISASAGVETNPPIASSDLRNDSIPPSKITPIQVLSKTLTAGSSVPDGSSITNVTVTEANNSEPMIQDIHRQIYIGNISPGNKMPESISSSIYPHYEWDSMFDGNGVSIETTPYRAVHKIQVRNNSGATQTIIFQVTVRYIINNSDNASV